MEFFKGLFDSFGVSLGKHQQVLFESHLFSQLLEFKFLCLDSRGVCEPGVIDAFADITDVVAPHDGVDNLHNTES